MPAETFNAKEQEQAWPRLLFTKLNLIALSRPATWPPL